MRSISRNITAKVETLLGIFPCVALIGARQTGKTYLARELRPDWRYLDLEKPSDYQVISQNAELFLKQFPNYIIFDEAQNYPELFNVLRGIIDDDRQHKGRFILTGSSSPELLKEISESLAGRIGIVEVGTLKANEYYNTPLTEFYNQFQDKLTAETLPKDKPSLSREQMGLMWLKGGYPEPLLNEDNTAYQLWMENYIDTYINRDIAHLFPRLDRQKYQRFILMLGKLSGAIINKAELGRALEFNESTAREYLSVADKTFIWRELLSFESSVIKSTVKMPKGHFRDTGLLHYISRVNSMGDLLTDPIIGRSFESFVIEELIKGIKSLTVTNWSAYYYRTRSGAEVDLILDGPFGLLPIEVKYGTFVKTSALTSLQNYVNQHKLPFGVVINQAEMPMWLTDNIFQLPVGYL